MRNDRARANRGSVTREVLVLTGLLAGLAGALAEPRPAGAQQPGPASVDTKTVIAAPGTLAVIGSAAVPNAWGEVLARVYPSVVKVYGAGGFVGIPAYGTGVVIDAQGFILTAFSVALETDALKV